MRFFLVTVCLFGSFCYLPVAAFADDKHLSVLEFRELNPPSGIHKITGYVVKSYQCPPCPQGRACKPCMGNNILLSDEPSLQETYPSGGNYVVVFVDTPQTFTLGVLYSLRVKVLKSKSTGYDVNDLQLKDAIVRVE